MAESYKLDELKYFAAGGRAATNRVWIAHVKDVQVFKILRDDGRLVYTISRKQHLGEQWFALDPLPAQCVIYHLLGNPTGNL